MDGELRQITTERLEDDIARLSAELSQRLERWLALVAEFDRRGGARMRGFRGTSEWLAWHCGISIRAARDHVRVARGLTERPLVRDAFAAGELSYSKVRALTRAPLSEDENRLLGFAREATAGQLERTVRALRSMPSAGVDVANFSHARRYVDWWWEEDGSLSLRARLPAEDGAAFIEAIETAAVALHAPTPGAAGPAPPPPPLGARRADALTEIVASGAPRAQVVLHVDEAALMCEGTGPGERRGEVCELEDGPAVPSEMARRLTCDGEIATARAAANGTVDYGRRRRAVPPPLRAALERRDRHCRFPGCERRHDLHAHHIRHWAHGGATDRDNLILLCRFHHRLVHEGGFGVAGPAEGEVRFCDRDGRPVDEGRRAPPEMDSVVA